MFRKLEEVSEKRPGLSPPLQARRRHDCSGQRTLAQTGDVLAQFYTPSGCGDKERAQCGRDMAMDNGGSQLCKREGGGIL